MATGIAILVGVVAYRVGVNNESLRWGFRWAVCAVIGGLAIYFVLSLNLPLSEWLLEQGGRWTIFWLSLAGAAIGWGLGVLWRSVDQRRTV
jgi:hypothetical protein